MGHKSYNDLTKQTFSRYAFGSHSKDKATEISE